MIGWLARKSIGRELIVTAVITGAVAGWSTFVDGEATLETALGAERSAIYATTASVAGALLGFFITTVTIVQGLISARGFARLRASSQYPTLWNVFRSAIRALAATSIVSLAALFVAHGRGEGWPMFYAVVGCIVASTLLVAQGIWLLERMLGIAVLDDDGARGS